MIKMLCGSNSFLLKTELDKLVSNFVATYGDFAVERYDSEDLKFKTLEGAILSVPLFSNQKMIIVRNYSQNKELTENLDNFLALDHKETFILLYETNIDKRSSYFKKLKSLKVVLEFSELDNTLISKWLVSEAKNRGGNLTLNDAVYLSSRVGMNQMRLSNELEKLLLYQPVITRNTIELLTELAPQSTIFELLDAAFNGNIAKVLKLYAEQKSLKVEPQQILALISWQLQTLCIAKTSTNQPAESAIKSSGISPYSYKKSFALSRNISLQFLKDLVSKTLNLDVRLKTESLDPDDALLELLLSIST